MSDLVFMFFVFSVVELYVVTCSVQSCPVVALNNKSKELPLASASSLKLCPRCSPVCHCVCGSAFFLVKSEECGVLVSISSPPGTDKSFRVWKLTHLDIKKNTEMASYQVEVELCELKSQ